jgi:hypothetical protein
MAATPQPGRPAGFSANALILAGLGGVAVGILVLLISAILLGIFKF